ncbi:hypothetical protein M407DRAFT_17604 [Tulasnella calospora MUT 4182]|uniref:BTB domain-containing protein n=1 Tax=Tulasnella calospora MUT 4182 TaxID=1051891 RepID=A0A0C3QVJ8_9AGAM|nr:hypothetical protein M407DRAFT_17604 [Tulasnella calospora MUT 4182]
MPSEHPKYGDASYMVFLVEDILFHVPLRRLKQSQFFREMIEETHTGLESEGKSNENPIFLSGISVFEMTSFLDALEASFLSGDPKLEFAQWAGALHLATMWSFDDVRDMIITHMDKAIWTADPLDRIDTSLKCRVEKWLYPAYEALCQRAESLKDEEVERLGLRRSAAIWRVRESLEFNQTPISTGCPSCGFNGVTCRSCEYCWSLPQPGASVPPARKITVKKNQKHNGVTALDLIKKEAALNFV